MSAVPGLWGQRRVWSPVSPLCTGGWGGLVFIDSHCFSLLMWASVRCSTDLSCLSPLSVRLLPPLLHSGIFSQLSHDQVTGSTLLASIPPPLCLSALIPPLSDESRFLLIFLVFFFSILLLLPYRPPLDLSPLFISDFSSFHLSPSPKSHFCSRLSSPVRRVQRLSGSTHTKHQHKR